MAKIKVAKINNKVYLTKFPNNYELASTFLRFQEFYECPRFRGRRFTLEQFKRWYKAKFGKFSYYNDWDGFNIPGSVLVPFYKGRFNPLSRKERKFLKLFSDLKKSSYIIGISICDKNRVKHEIAHALFRTNRKYRRMVLRILKKYNLKKIKNEIKNKDYARNVLLDEVHAWVMFDKDLLESSVPRGLRNSLADVFKRNAADLEL